MAYSEKVSIVVEAMEDLLEVRFGSGLFTEETAVGNQAVALSARFSLVGCKTTTTVGEIAQVLCERDIVTEQMEKVRVGAEAMATIIANF